MSRECTVGFSEPLARKTAAFHVWKSDSDLFIVSHLFLLFWETTLTKKMAHWRQQISLPNINLLSIIVSWMSRKKDVAIQKHKSASTLRTSPCEVPPQDHQINWMGVLDISDSILFIPRLPYPSLSPTVPGLLQPPQSQGVIGSLGYLTPTYEKGRHTKRGGSGHLKRKWNEGAGIE